MTTSSRTESLYSSMESNTSEIHSSQTNSIINENEPASWELIHQPGKITKSALNLDEENKNLVLTVEIEIPFLYQATLREKFSELPEAFTHYVEDADLLDQFEVISSGNNPLRNLSNGNTLEFVNYLENQISTAQLKAEELATHVLLTLLEEKRLIHPDDSKKIKHNPFLQCLLTYSKVAESLLKGTFFLSHTLNINNKHFKLSQDDIHFILDPAIFSLIEKSILTIDQVPKISNLLRFTLKQSFLRPLLLAKKVSIEDIAALTIQSLDLIERHPYLSIWLQAGILPIKEIINLQPLTSKNFSHFYAEIFARRLYAIYLDEPFTLQDRLDDFENIIANLQTIEVDKEFFINMMMKKLLDKILSEAVLLSESVQLHPKERKLFKLILANFSSLDLNVPWSVSFSSLINIGQETLNQTSKLKFFTNPSEQQQFNIFNENNETSSNTPKSAIEKFCHGVIKFAKYLPSTPVQNIPVYYPSQTRK